MSTVSTTGINNTDSPLITQLDKKE